MGTYLVLGNGPAGLSLLVAYSALKRNAMAACVGARARYGATPHDRPKQALTVAVSAREAAAVGSNV
ncbi:MAG: hypothetical protein ACREHD_25050 [Pirellulales bacterium]